MSGRLTLSFKTLILFTRHDKSLDKMNYEQLEQLNLRLPPLNGQLFVIDLVHLMIMTFCLVHDKTSRPSGYRAIFGMLAFHNGHVGSINNDNQSGSLTHNFHMFTTYSSNRHHLGMIDGMADISTD